MNIAAAATPQTILNMTLIMNFTPAEPKSKHSGNPKYTVISILVSAEIGKIETIKIAKTNMADIPAIIFTITMYSFKSQILYFY